MIMEYIKCSNNYKSFNMMHIKNNVKYILEDCEILCIPLWHEWWECDQSCVSNIRQVLTRESRMVSPNLCPRPLSRYDHGADFMPAFFFVFYYISFFVTVHDPELIDD